MNDAIHAPFSAAAMREKTGLELIAGMVDGTLPGAPIARLMNMQAVEAGFGFVVFSGDPTPDHYNPQGSVHGGYAATLLDSCMGCAVYTTLGAGIGFTTIDINITYVRAMTAATGPVFARGEVINSGRRVATVRGTLTDGGGKIIAHGTSSCLIFPIGG